MLHCEWEADLKKSNELEACKVLEGNQEAQGVILDQVIAGLGPTASEMAERGYMLREFAMLIQGGPQRPQRI